VNFHGELGAVATMDYGGVRVEKPGELAGVLDAPPEELVGRQFGDFSCEADEERKEVV
jgi:hypothetical protein